MSNKNRSSDEKFLENLIITDGIPYSPGNIPTGHFVLDFVIHYGEDPTNINLHDLEDYDPCVPLGLPLGKVVEFFGGEGGGKSSLAYRVAGNCQKLGYTAAWIDAEASFSTNLARINGCDAESIIRISTSENDMYAEMVLDTMISLCKCEKVPRKKDGQIVYVDSPKVIIVDSVASLIPKVVEEKDSEQTQVGVLARILSQNLGKVVSAAEKNGVLVIFINQLREKIGLFFGNPETSPGGNALKHFCSTRLKITKRKSKDSIINKIDDFGDEVMIGRYSYVNIEKNRFGKPYLSSIDIPIYYEDYFPSIEEILFDTGRQLQIISVRKGVYKWEDVKIEGKNNFIEEIKNKNLTKKLSLFLEEKAIENGALVPPEISIFNKKNIEKKNIMKEESSNEMDGSISREGKGEDSDSLSDKPKKRGRKKSS